MLGLALRILVLVGVSFYGAVTGGIAGIFYALIIFGLFCLAFQIANGMFQGIMRAVRQPRTSITHNTMNVRVEDGPAIRGERMNPDPTRPTTDDFMGIIESRSHRKA